jgi:hypothetical protein
METAAIVNPPLYSAIAISTFLALVFGLIFKDMLEYRVAEWHQHRESQNRIDYQRPSLMLTYLALCLSLVFFLATCLSVFGFALWFALLTGTLMMVFLGIFIWWQLGSVLQLLVLGGSEALDIDSLAVPQNVDPPSDQENNDS